MADQWYFGAGGKRFGPFTGAQLREQGALGKLQPTDTVWKAGVANGVVATKVKNLFPAATFLEHAAVPVEEDRASSLPPYSGLPSCTPETVSSTEHPLQQGQPGNPEAAPAEAEPGFTSTDRHGTADEPPREMIPDGLMLKPIPEQNDSEFPISPASVDAPGPESMENRKPAHPAYPNHQRSTTQDAPPRKGRALAVRGAVISSQDGEFVHFRKKCDKCGYEDTSRTSMRIRNGTSRENFFCPKCRKAREVRIQGVI